MMTIRLSKYLLLLSCLVFFTVTQLRGETEMRSFLKAKSDISKQLTVALELQSRFSNVFQCYDRTIFEPSLHYKLSDNWRVSAVYRYQIKNDLENHREVAHRTSLLVRYRQEWSDFQLKLRTGLQYGISDLYYITDYRNALVNRNLVELQYHVFGTRFYPYLNVEVFCHLNNPYGARLNKWRAALGSDFQLYKNIKINVAYLLENEFNKVNPINSHIFQLGLNYDF